MPLGQFALQGPCPQVQQQGIAAATGNGQRDSILRIGRAAELFGGQKRRLTAEKALRFAGFLPVSL